MSNWCFVVIAACSMGCGTKDSSPPAAGSATSTGSGGSSILSGWVQIDHPEYGFRMMGPGPVKEENHDEPAQNLKLRSFQIPLTSSLVGQVIYLEYTGAGAFDMETGIEGACTQFVVGAHGTMKSLVKGTDQGRSTRTFTFVSTAGPSQFTGTGRAIAIGPKKVIAVLTLLEGGSLSGDTATAFLDAFKTL